MKKIFISVVTVISVLSAAGYFYLNVLNASPDIANKSQENKVAMVTLGESTRPLKTATSFPNFGVIYTNLDQLSDKASVIVQGQVTSINYFDYNTITYTKELIKVTKSYNSNVKVGDVITFVEPGGITTQAALIRSNDNKFNQPITEVDENTKVQVLFGGDPLMKVNENILFFGVEDNLPMIPEKYYVSLGAFQGKFKINGDSIERYVPRGMESDLYSSLKMSKTGFEQKLSNAINNKK